MKIQICLDFNEVLLNPEKFDITLIDTVSNDAEPYNVIQLKGDIKDVAIVRPHKMIFRPKRTIVQNGIYFVLDWNECLL